MQMRLLVIFLGIFSFTFPVIWSVEEVKTETNREEKIECSDKESFSETKHQIIINGQTLAYHAVTGNLILKDEKCQPKASIFYVSYTKDGSHNSQERPITFCFNGGPWLFLCVASFRCIGPKRVF